MVASNFQHQMLMDVLDVWHINIYSYTYHRGKDIFFLFNLYFVPKVYNLEAEKTQ